ncbi:MAG: HAMP domain-containing sensor histidine kinase [Eubacteriales bacterium]|nr:HAMP domain-containing sensor histidine kinase [Eubacteriales bacterium]
MRKREIKKERLSLILLCSVMVFVFLLFSILLSILLLALLSRTGLFAQLGIQVHSLGQFSLLMSITSTVIGAGIARLSSKFIVRPFNQLINQMNRLASGDFSARLEYGNPLQKDPTFAELTDSFNTMAKELESTEILRGDFVNNFSHEFKTPIVSIAGYAKLLRRASLTKQEQQEYLTIIEEESLRLSAMATNVLSLTKVENQNILTDVTRFNLSEQIRSCILLLEPKWDAKSIEFRIEFAEQMIWANEELLKQIWINLIDNAIKFSPAGETVEVRIHAADRQVAVTVLNRGEPIPADKMKKIWNKFYQGDESHASQGNGIGLALVDKIVRLHNGQASVACEDGQVAFTVVLPQ